MAWASGALTAGQASAAFSRVLKSSSRGPGYAGSNLASLRRHPAGRWPAPVQATAAPEKGYQRRQEGGRPPAATPFPPPSPGPVLVSVTVPNCRLGAGEELRLVGDSMELGGWELAAAPPLTRAPDGSTWEVVVPLMPGQYQCKLVIARSNRGSVVCWEGGPNRQLRVPHLEGLEVPPGAPLWQGVCRFGDTSRTQLKASPRVAPQQLKDAATAAVQRCVELAEKRDTLAARLDHLANEVETSEVRVASKRGELQQMVADELAQLRQRGLVSQQVARLEGMPAAPAAAPAPDAPPAPFAAAPPQPRQPQPEAKQAPPVAAALLVKQAAQGRGAGVSAASDGGSEFRFQGREDEEAGPSAFQLAKQQLLELLPAEAEAALEARWRRERLGAAAAAATPTPAPSKAGAEPKPDGKPAAHPSAVSVVAAPAAAPPALATEPEPHSGPAAVPVAGRAAAAKSAAAKAAAQASELKAAASRIKAAAPSAAPKPASSVPAVSLKAALPAGKQQVGQQEQAAQREVAAAKAPAMLRRAPADFASLMDKPSLPVVAALAVGQQMFQAYRALWGCALAAVLPTPAAQRGADTVAAVTLGVVASLPFLG